MSKNPLPDYSQLARWTVNDVCTWLMENRFGSYVSQFREYGIDGGRFASLKDVDLSQMRCPLSKRTDLIKCIRNIPNRDVNPPTVANIIPSRAHPHPRIEDRQPARPPQNDVDSESDDDYEAWGEFDNFNDESSDEEDYMNEQEQEHFKKPSRGHVEPEEPQEDYANYNPDQNEEESSVNKNGLSIADSLKQALQQRNRVNQRQEKPPQPEEPAIPPRPGRPGRSGNVPSPQQPPVPRPGRRGRDPIPVPEPEDQPAYIETDDPLLNQPDYEVPEDVPKPPPSRPPMTLPVPVEDDQPTYEDPDETDHAPAPPPSRGGRRPAPKPAEPIPSPQSDWPEDFYEDPDQNTTPAPLPERPKKTKPPMPKQKDSPLSRTISEPDQPAPPPPRHGHERIHKRAPIPEPINTQDSDDSSSSDYEKPDNRGTSTAKKPLPKAPENESRAVPKPKGRAALPSPSTESGKKLPAGAVPIIGLQPEVKESPKMKHSSRDVTPPPVPSSRTPHRGSQDENIPPSIPPSKPPGRTAQTKDARSLPPTPNQHRGVNGVPNSFNKPQGRGSVIDRPPPPVPGTDEFDISQQYWYQSVNRTEADEALKGFGKNGTFLIRPSTKAAQPYTLQIYNNGKVYNLPIRQRDDSTYALGKEKKGEQTFETVNDLVEFFRKHTLILAAGDSGQTRLKHNCPRI
ncbi:lymphocyte cytosolic protein 2 isoform X10 [Magallana gigas]|uniref:lymphocyte cytosolic protein 2 isoform X10 n=1 Tax=Magallana gigas TaxID=29159 RepID=UPI00333E2053